jgi:hypothetical protein
MFIERAIVDIAAGDELTHSYLVDGLWNPAHIRGHLLRQTKFFSCECERCGRGDGKGCDESRGFVCPTCGKGLVRLQWARDQALLERKTRTGAMSARGGAPLRAQQRYEKQRQQRRPGKGAGGGIGVAEEQGQKWTEEQCKKQEWAEEQCTHCGQVPSGPVREGLMQLEGRVGQRVMMMESAFATMPALGPLCLLELYRQAAPAGRDWKEGRGGGGVLSLADPEHWLVSKLHTLLHDLYKADSFSSNCTGHCPAGIEATRRPKSRARPVACSCPSSFALAAAHQRERIAFLVAEYPLRRQSSTGSDGTCAHDRARDSGRPAAAVAWAWEQLGEALLGALGVAPREIYLHDQQFIEYAQQQQHISREGEKQGLFQRARLQALQPMTANGAGLWTLDAMAEGRSTSREGRSTSREGRSDTDPLAPAGWPLDFPSAKREAVEALRKATQMLGVLHGEDDPRAAEARRKLAVAEGL